MGGKVTCKCGAQVFVPNPGICVQCPSCKHMVTLPAVELETIPLEPEPERPANTCARCGAPMPAGDVVCLACGQSTLGTVSPREMSAAKPESSLKTIIYFAAAALIVAGLIVGMVVFRSKDKQAPPPPPDKDRGYIRTVVTAPQRVRQTLDVAAVRQCIQSFAALEGRYPKDLQELAQRDMAVPPPPEGYEYEYDPKTGEVSLKQIEPPPAPKK